tara:strand:+ start:2191 stop:3357 length:1167 start_codon:yes stop_codon:yes gene_type:complete
MIKYLKYFISTIFLILAIYICPIGSHYPTYFFIGFSLTIILGDILLKKDIEIGNYNYPLLINLPIYINLPLLIILISMVVYILSNYNSILISEVFNKYLQIDLVHIKNSVTLIDKISLIGITSLFIGIMGTVPGHELTHRKRDKFDMFFGNWLLSLSWDCAFALEHVYGHHKNVGLPTDPATARRGENIYLFILRASFKEQIDAWKIEIEHLKRRGYNSYSLHNRMIIGYLRSLSITIMAYFIGGLSGVIIYLLCAFIAKALLEVINYTEHYGLVREPGKPVEPKHSWNSNDMMSSILLYNVTRHSAHHEKANLKFWELESYPNAPMMPQGYLSMLYLAIFLPYFYHKIMAKKLIHWDLNHASPKEREIAKIQNKDSGIPLLIKSVGI